MKLIRTPRSINTIKEANSSFKTPQRDNVKIMIIDNEPFPNLERLRRSNFNLRYEKDCKNVALVSETDIILVDIDGVAIELNETYQGAYLIKEIRTRYPAKVIIGYTSKSYNASFNKYFNYADFFLEKDLSSESWVENLDHAIDLSVNPEYQWKKLRDHLLNLGVPIFNVMQIEDNFVRHYLGIDKEFPKKKIVGDLSTDLRAILQSFSGSILFKIIFGV